MKKRNNMSPEQNARTPTPGAEFMEFAMATNAELPPMNGGLDAFWAAMATRTTAGGDHAFATLSAVMKVYLLMPHNNAD